MPLPLLAWAAIGVTGLFGAGKTVKAVMDNSEANDVNDRANSIVSKAKKHITKAKEASGSSLQALGGKKAFVLNNGIKFFLDEFSKLKNVDFSQTEGLEEISKFVLDKHNLTGLREMSDFAGSIVGGTITGAGAGALTALGAWGGATLLASASTGTAIATLSGAAATNATLAFFGGGSLAVGGLGMAGGAAVLGGLVAAPALAVLGLFMGSSASKNLNNAYSNLSEAKKFREEMNTAAVMCNGIRRRAYMFERLLIRLDSLMYQAVNGMRSAINAKGVDYRKFSPDEKKNVAAAASLAKAVKTLLDTPILTEEGKLTGESLSIADTVRKALP